MKVIRWSHSALKKFEQCPRQYHEVKVLKKYPKVDTAYTLYGTEVHSAIEDYINGKKLEDKYLSFKPVIDAILKKPGRKHTELEMGITTDLNPCKPDDLSVWAIGIADLAIIDDDNLLAWVVDWKTGSDRYPDMDQLVLMSLMIFAHFPHIRRVRSALVFLTKNTMPKHVMERDEAKEHWQKYRERVARLESAFGSGVWNPKQGALCPWCPVTGCEHWKPPRS